MPEQKELKRVIGVGGVALTTVNFTIGAGIFVLPALIGLQLGAMSAMGYLMCALMFTAIILCYVEIGSRVKSTGGSYAYVENAFGALPGFIVNWLFFFGWGILSDAAIMNVVADSLSVIFPVFTNNFIRALFFLVIISVMIFVNIRDVKWSVRFVETTTIIKLIPLVALIILGLFYIKSNPFRFNEIPSLNSINQTALILFFAFAGFESSLNVSGEIKNPERTIPKGLLFGGIFVLLIFLLIQLVVQGVLGDRLGEFSIAPLAGVASMIVGSAGTTILLLAAAISGLSSINGDVLSSPRLLFAGAKDGLFPKYLGKIHPRFETPHMAVITYGVAIFIFSVSGGFKQLAVLASGALLLIYLAVVLAMIKLRMKNEKTENSFRVPGGLLIPAIAIISILYVFSNLSRNEMISISIFVGVVTGIFFLIKNKNQT